MKSSPHDSFEAFEKRIQGSTNHNDLLALRGCHDLEKITHALFYMVVANCLFFERFLFEVTEERKAFKNFKEWCKTEIEKNAIDASTRIDLEAYFSVRHAIMHLGGNCSALHIFSPTDDKQNDSGFRKSVRCKLKAWGIDENSDLCDFSEKSHRDLDNAWSGIRIFLRGLANDSGLTRMYFSDRDKSPSL
jgi:hypothetical protein